MRDEQQKETIGRIKRTTTTLPPPLPIIGNIKIGEVVKGNGGKEHPTSLDYFKPTGDYAKLFTDVYGEKPNNIQIIFISDDNNHSCLEEYDARDGKGRRAGYGNGEDVYLFHVKGDKYLLWNTDKQKHEEHTMKEDEEYVKFNAEKDREYIGKYSKDKGLKWQVVLTLHFVIPKIKGVFGVWRFQTRGAKSSVLHIVNSFDTVKGSAGTIINIPFDLTVEMVKSQKPDSKSRFPVVNLIANISQQNIEMLGEYMQQGKDIRKLGMLTEEKLLGLQKGDAPALPPPTN